MSVTEIRMKVIVSPCPLAAENLGAFSLNTFSSYESKLLLREQLIMASNKVTRLVEGIRFVLVATNVVCIVIFWLDN